MSVIEDVRSVIQDLVEPRLKSLGVEVAANEDKSKMRVEALSAKIDAKVEALTALIMANHATVMNALNLEKRVADIERKQGVAA